MSSRNEKNFLLIELVNRVLRENLHIALMAISNKKQSLTNLAKYEEDKKLLHELIEMDQIQMENLKMVKMIFIQLKCFKIKRKFFF